MCTFMYVCNTVLVRDVTANITTCTGTGSSTGNRYYMLTCVFTCVCAHVVGIHTHCHGKVYTLVIMLRGPL